jgi:hypothetical protein
MGCGFVNRLRCALALLVSIAALQSSSALQHGRLVGLHTVSAAAQVLNGRACSSWPVMVARKDSALVNTTLAFKPVTA